MLKHRAFLPNSNKLATYQCDMKPQDIPGHRQMRKKINVPMETRNFITGVIPIIISQERIRVI